MKKLFFVLALLVTLFFVQPVSAQPADRYATCDVCGFCVSNQDDSQNPQTFATITPPGNWEKCRNCLYPDITSPASSGDTLKIDPSTNAPPAPKQGRQYTMLGCIKTDLTDFSQTGAAGTVVAKLLQVIFSISGGVAFLYIMYGAFLLATSQADPERMNHGKKVVTGAIIGLMFTLSAVLLVQIIASGVLKIPGFSAGQ